MSDFLGTTSFAASLVLLVTGAGVTVGVSLVGIVLGFVIAVPVCMARLSRSRAARFAGGLYVSFFRGVPLLVQLLVIYYALPSAGLELPSYVAAALALGVCTAAYQAENLRGGVLIVPGGQQAAARAFGYRGVQIWRHIVLPQALRAALPAIVNEMIAILKASSLISVVGVAELTRVSQNIVARDVRPIAWYGIAGLLYLAINLVIAGLGHRTELFLWRGQRGGAVSLDWALLAEYAPQLLHGTLLTVLLWIGGAALALVIGFACALLLASPAAPVIRGYVGLFRGTPLLVQLFLVYAGGPHIGIMLDALTVGLWGLGLYGGAYFTEIFRAGFQSIPAGQIDAARCFGLTRAQTVRTIVVPQMLTLVLPPVVNALILLLKETAVLSILTIPELTFQVTGMTLETFAFAEPYLALALVYWCLVEVTARAGRFAEMRLSHRIGWA